MEAFVVSLIPVLRWLIVVSSSVVLLGSFRGFMAFGTGDQRMITCVKSSLFLFALGLWLSQSSFLFEGVPAPAPFPRLTVSLTVICLALLHAGFLLFWLRRFDRGQLRRVFRHLKEASAIAELADVDSAAAARLAAEARELCARHMIVETTEPGNGN